MEVQPVASGLRLGTLVEVDGILGQLVSYSGAEDKFRVVLVNGKVESISSSSVKIAKNLSKPGEGGNASSFDVLMGPRTPSNVLADEMSTCIFEKGFCVLKICQSAKEVKQTVETVKQMGADGKLGRLCEEVEEGYLGMGGAAKIAWLDPDSGEFPDDEILRTNENNMNYLASLLQPGSADTLGKAIAERSPALLALSLNDDEEEDFPNPAADDRSLGDFMDVWQRGLIRVVHFMGPATASVTLDSKEGPEAAALPRLQDSITLSAEPNTIVLFRTECYDYSCESDGEVLSMISSFNSHRPGLVVSNFEEVETLFTSDGPPAPAGDSINVLNLATRLGKCSDSAEMYGSYLQAGTDGVTLIPLIRFDVMMYYEGNPENVLSRPNCTTQKHMAYVDGVDMFDNKYFEISQNEAVGMDPLQRQVMEVGGMCMGMYGIPKKESNKASHHSGFSVGVDKADYPNLAEPQGGCNVMAIIANRFSFAYNLKGPNYVCDTACSASLVATHLAKYLLEERTYDPLDFHIAIGTHWVGSVGAFIGTSQSQMTNPEGRCMTFNATANGYLRGEGTSGMLMKMGNFPKEREGIWRSSMAGQDGRSASLTAPNGPAQEQCIAKAMKMAKMTPPESSAWETHGTGTSLGDPIEVGAVRKVQIKHLRHSPLQIGTAKANTGHLEGGAAMAGIVKCVLTAGKALSVPTLHCRQLNPHLEATAFCAFFSVESTPWQYNSGHSQISSFGFGGTNGHAVIWGEDMKQSVDVSKTVMKRLANMKPPEVRAYGRNPADWETDWLTKDAKSGDQYNLILSTGNAADSSIRVDKVDQQHEEQEEEVYYSITGNFNDWQPERMMAGEIPGLFTATVEIPEGTGDLEWHFVMNDDSNKAICPNEANCSRRLVPIVGPQADSSNRWSVHGTPAADMQIELMVQGDRKSVMWLQI